MKILTKLLKASLVLTLLLLILWSALAIFVKTEKGHKWIMNQLVHYVDNEIQAQLTYESIEFIFPLRLRIHQVTVEKDKTPLFSIKQLELNCLSPKLLEGRIVCSKLYAKGVNIGDHPFFYTKSNGNFSIPEKPFPIYIKIEKLLIEDLQVTPSLYDHLILDPQIKSVLKTALIKIQGFIKNNPKENSIAAHLLFTMTSDQLNHPNLQLAIDLQKQQFSISGNINHFPLNTFPLLTLGESLANISFHTEAPLSTWNTFFLNKPHSPIGGEFQINLTTLERKGLAFDLLQNPVSLYSKYKLISRNSIQLFDTQLDTSYLSLIGEAFWDFDLTIEKGTFSGSINDWKPLTSLFASFPALQGATQFHGFIEGSILKPNLQLHVDTPFIKVNDLDFKNVKSSFLTKVSQNTIEGLVDLTTDHDRQPYHLNTVFKYTPESIEVSQLDLQGLDTRLTGNGILSFHDYISTGQLDFTSENVNILTSFFSSKPVQGAISAHIKMREGLSHENHKKQILEAEINGQNLRGGDWQIEQLSINSNLEDSWNQLMQSMQVSSTIQMSHLKTPSLTAQKLSVQANYKLGLFPLTITDLTTDLEGIFVATKQFSAEQLNLAGFIQNTSNPFEQGELSFHSKIIKNQDIELDELKGQVAFDSSNQEHPFKLSGRGYLQEALDFSIEGLLHKKDNGIETQVHFIKGSLGPYPLITLSPFKFAITENLIHIEGLAFRLGEGEFQADLTLEKENIEGRLIGTQIPSELLYYISPEAPLTGRFSFVSNIKGPVNNPKGDFKLKLHHIQITEEVFVTRPYMDGEIDLQLNSQNLNLEGVLNGVGKTPIKIKGFIPLALQFSPFKFKINEKEPLELSLDAEGELDPFLHLFFNDNANVTGQAKIALILSGQIQSPKIKGEIDLSEGTYESLATGAIYHSIQAHLEGDGSNLLLKSFSAKDNKQGSINAYGTISLDSANSYPFQFNIQPSQVYIMDSDYASISASGALVLTGNQHQGKIDGTLTVDSATIRMEEALPTQIKSVDLTYINIPEGETLSYLQSHDTHRPLHLNVKINMPNKVMILGKNLNSEWKGSVDVTGTPQALLLNGELRVIDGDYNFNGKKFALTQGTIHFAGPADKKTSIYVVASKQLDKIKAEILVKGLTNKLGVSFRSNPPLSQREVLSYILFNRGISDITSDQGNQLTQSFVELNSSDQAQTDMLTRLRNNIGIDRLDFTSTDKENKELSLQVGKYISEGVMVSINKSINAAANRVAIEAKLRENLQAQAEVGDDAQGKIMLKWKKDY